MMEQKVLILGARGRFGAAAARAFAQGGWQVLAQARPGRALSAQRGVQWLESELHNPQALADAAAGCSVVVHALNPAYTKAAWSQQVPVFMRAAIEVATRLDALLMLPGNVYNYGSGMPPLLSEATPEQADTVKGRIRVAAEQQMARACESNGLQAVVIRAGDFFGSGTGSWFDRMLVKDLAKGVLNYPGPMDVATPWAYLPDLARSFVQVAEQRARLARFERMQFAGYNLTGRQWQDALTEVAWEQGWLPAGGGLKVKHLPWNIVSALGMVLPTWGSLAEMRYLWTTPHALDSTRLAAIAGPATSTPLVDAIRTSLADLGLGQGPVRGHTTVQGELA
jgi:nucleoside-diphosphate-sugar epimerase